LPETVREEARAWLERQGIRGTQPLLAAVPGGGASWGTNARYKQWPAERFAALLDPLAKKTNGQVILLGDSADRPLCEAVAIAMRGKAMVLEPAPSALLLAGVVQCCQLIVGNDSGALHLAAAVGTPSVAIFGPANPLVYGPAPSMTQKHRVVARSLACRPCYERFHLPPCPFGIRCLTALDPQEVYDAAASLLPA